MGVLARLIKHIADTGYEAIPSDAVEATKKQILDTLGAIVGGSTSGDIGELVNLVKEWGGKEESTIVAFSGKVPAPNAALVNGALCVRLDYDDSHEWDWSHPSRTTVPPAFAIAERRGKVSGKDFITAVALGFDLECRLSRARTLNFVPFALSTGVFGAAAIAGKILKLNKKKLTNTMGIAYQLLTGAVAVSTFGSSPTKGLTNGLFCRAGVTAALIAERGFTSGGDCLEGPEGLFKALYRGFYEPALTTVDLGKDFRGTTNSQKEYPCCHFLQNPIEATVGIVREHNIKPEDVAEVVVHIPPVSLSLFEEGRQVPKTTFAAQFSGPFAIASAIIHPDIGIGSFSKEAIQDKKIQELAKKVSGKLEPRLGGVRAADPAFVDIKTRGGQIYSKQVDHPFGSPENPMSLDDIAVKFKHCCQYSIKPIPKGNQDKVIQMVKGLEDVADVSGIIHLLA